MSKRAVFSVALMLALLLGVGGVRVLVDTRSLEELRFPVLQLERSEFLDRSGMPMTRTYENDWNVYAQLHRADVPALLLQSILYAEDKRFYDHDGVDWKARSMAIFQNLRTGSVVRGASTITEQLVRMTKGRPRTLYNRILEHREARKLEQQYSKDELLMFYVNQVPLGRRIRGMQQAAREYFGRSLSTLHPVEMIFLATMIRAPSALAPERSPAALKKRAKLLANRLLKDKIILPSVLEELDAYHYQKPDAVLSIRAPHVVRHLRQHCKQLSCGVVEQTTIDPEIQDFLQRMLDERVHALQSNRVSDAAALVINHETNEIVAWVNAGSRESDPGFALDAVLVPRQPGSTLKPFVYAASMSQGWTAATLVLDAPLIEGVGSGLHDYQNYSGLFYGPLRLRNALGNSLNTPAVRAIQYAGVSHVLSTLRNLGMNSLKKRASFYGDGLALGNGEVTLYQLTDAYATLARGGVKRSSRALYHQTVSEEKQVYDYEVTALITDILSDEEARSLEFSGGMLSFPGRVAVKTGTSNDYRDAWALGYSEKFTAGIWMGNLDGTAMDGISGSKGPALVLRALFQKLEDGPALSLPRSLLPKRICAKTGLLPTESCPMHVEYFRRGHLPGKECGGHSHQDLPELRHAVSLRTPTHNLRMVMDPRVPDDYEYYEFTVHAPDPVKEVVWFLNDKQLAVSKGPRYRWKLAPGSFSLYAEVRFEDGRTVAVNKRSFFVRGATVKKVHAELAQKKKDGVVKVEAS